MSDKKPRTTSKQPYETPEIRQVSLRPEEAVLGACKTSSVSGPGSGSCVFPAPCSSVGS